MQPLLRVREGIPLDFGGGGGATGGGLPASIGAVEVRAHAEYRSDIWGAESWQLMGPYQELWAGAGELLVGSFLQRS